MWKRCVLWRMHCWTLTGVRSSYPTTAIFWIACARTPWLSKATARFVANPTPPVAWGVITLDYQCFQVVYYEGSYAEYEDYKENILGETTGKEFEHSKLKL